MRTKESEIKDIESFNDNILRIDLDDLEVGAMEQRLELTVASLFDGDGWGLLPGGGSGCDQFSCDGYWPAA